MFGCEYAPLNIQNSFSQKFNRIGILKILLNSQTAPVLESLFNNSVSVSL